MNKTKKHQHNNETTIESKQQHWNNYIDNTIGYPPYYLYPQALTTLPRTNTCCNVLELGTGAGDVVIDLMEKGWNVTGIDLAPRSGEIIHQRTKHLSGNFSFQQVEFQHFKATCEYDLVLSFFSLPFLKKDDLDSAFNKIKLCMKPGSILAANFFGDKHSFVKAGKAHALSKDELLQLLNENDFKIDFFQNRFYKQSGFENALVDWDVFDVIAVKK